MERMSDTPERLYYPGANYTADAVVVHGEKVCLILRSDTGEWALPGGFCDVGEDSHTAAVREASEETDLQVSNGTKIFSGKVIDHRNTEHRWIESDAYYFELDQTAEPTAGDDATAARWFAFDQLPDTLHGSHQTMITQAQRYRELRDLLKNTEVLPVQPGHMGYDYTLNKTDRGRYLFSKSHNPRHFTESERSDHSKTYLLKEAETLDQLRQHGFIHIPGHHLLINGTNLVSEGLPTEAGWHWAAPSNNTPRYIEDVIDATTSLQSLPLLQSQSPDLDAIDSYEADGWRSFEDHTYQAIADQVTTLQPRLHDDTRSLVPDFIADLQALHRLQLHPSRNTTVNSHHDLRQNNIAWHPDHGARIIDWSWSSPGTPKSDTTMFLIDLEKSGIDTTQYLTNYFDPEHAHRLIGFWTAQLLQPTRSINSTVRLHQLASAITAYRLLLNV